MGSEHPEKLDWGVGLVTHIICSELRIYTAKVSYAQLSLDSSQANYALYSDDNLDLMVILKKPDSDIGCRCESSGCSAACVGHQRISISPSLGTSALFLWLMSQMREYHSQITRPQSSTVAVS